MYDVHQRCLTRVFAVVLASFGCESQAVRDVTVCDPPDEPGANVFVSAIDGSSGSLCLPRALAADGGHVNCQVVEAVPAPCDCAASSGLRIAPRSLDTSVRRALVEGNAGDERGTTCTEVCVCELQQLAGAALTSCQTDVAVSGPPGFCYVEPETGLGSAELVLDCPPTMPRKFRFLGSETLDNGNRWFVACLGGG